MDTTPRYGPPPAPAPPPPRPSGADSFFDSMRRTGIWRTEDRWVGGVAAGTARRLGIDPALVRGLLVVLTFFGGLGLVLYGVGWALLAEVRDGRIHLQQAVRGDFDAALAGAIAVFIVGVSRPVFWWGFPGSGWGTAWVLALIGLSVAIVVSARGARTTPRAPNGRTPNGPTAPPPPHGAGAWTPPPAPTTDESDPMTTYPPTAPSPTEGTGALTHTVDAPPAGAPAPDHAAPADGDGPVSAPDLAAASDVAATDGRPTDRMPLAPGSEPTTYGATTSGASAYGPTTSGASAYGPTTYGGPAYGGPGYGSPAYGAPAYGSPAYDGPGYGTPATSFGDGGGAPPPAVPPVPPVPPRPPIPGPSPATVSVVLALCLLATAGLLLAHRVGVLEGNPVLVVGGSVLTLLGLGVVVSGMRGRRQGSLGGLALVLALVLVPTASAVAVLPGLGTVGTIGSAGSALAGDPTFRPTTAAEAREGYELGAGDLTVDLRDLAPARGTIEVPVEVAFGVARVLVPADAAVEVRASVAGGEIVGYLDDDWSVPSGARAWDVARGDSLASGLGIELVLAQEGTGSTGAPDIVVEVEVGFGQVIIEERS